MLHFKILRAHYVAFTWKHSHLPDPFLGCPEEWEWKLVDDRYDTNWLKTSQYPVPLASRGDKSGANDRSDNEDEDGNVSYSLNSDESDLES